MTPARTIAAEAPSTQRARLQYGVIPYRRAEDRIEIMLITSRKARRWIVPKGWPLGRKPSREVARLEALEEAGLEGAIGKDPFGSFHYNKRLKDGSVVRCRVDVFAFEVACQLKTWRERGERTRRWFDSQRAIKLVREQELKALIAAFVRSLENRDRSTLGGNARPASATPSRRRGETSLNPTVRRR
jgi:8-oxo-dGTP pyrophosphatase MutT (NUDIX family)